MTTVLIWVGVTLAYFVLRSAASKIIGDEARARVDDLPQVILAFALRRLPEDLRDSYRADWEGNLLAALHDSTIRYPATRVWKSLLFSGSLMISVRRVRKEFGAPSRIRQLATSIYRRLLAPDRRAETLQRVVTASTGAAGTLVAFQLARDAGTEWFFVGLVAVIAANGVRILLRRRRRSAKVVAYEIE